MIVTTDGSFAALVEIDECLSQLRPDLARPRRGCARWCGRSPGSPPTTSACPRHHHFHCHDVTNVTLVVTIVELEGAFSVITNLRMDLFQALHDSGALAASSGRGLSSWTLGTCDTRHTHTQLGAPPCDQASCSIVIDEC